MVFDKNHQLIEKQVASPDSHLVELCEVVLDLTDLKSLLPGVYEELCALVDKGPIKIIVLDLDRRPKVYFEDGSLSYLFPSEDILFNHQDLETLVQKLDIGADNRAILNKSLHSISVIRNIKGKVVGVTIRVGYLVKGLATLLQDILMTDDSVLFLGHPRSGKTSFIRDCVHWIGDTKHIIVVDTLSEMYGNVETVSDELYPARRLIVPSLDKQQEVIMEAIQNHTSDILVIDSIRNADLEACKYAKDRGWRLIASANGTFAGIINHPTMNQLLGLSSTYSSSPKRSEEPIFETIVEVKNTDSGRSVRIYRNVAEKVDAKLNNEKFAVQVRWNSQDNFLFENQQEIQ